MRIGGNIGSLAGLTAALRRVRDRPAIRIRRELALVGITVLWGATFVVVKAAVVHSGPLFFVGCRFLVAGVVALCVMRPALRAATRTEWIGGAVIGITIAGAHVLQTFGLTRIDSSASAFLTSLYIPLVPLIQWAVTRRCPHLFTWIGIAFASAGLTVMTTPGNTVSLRGVGEIATLACAVVTAIQIVLIGWFSGRVDLARVTVIQLFVASGVAFLAMGLADEPAAAFSWVWIAAAVALGGASVLIQLVMNWAQQVISPARAAIIYAGEPVWGGLAGRLAGELIPGMAIIGAALIVTGVLVSTLRPRRDLAVAAQMLRPDHA